jgi:hypothetical protein
LENPVNVLVTPLNLYKLINIALIIGYKTNARKNSIAGNKKRYPGKTFLNRIVLFWFPIVFSSFQISQNFRYKDFMQVVLCGVHLHSLHILSSLMFSTQSKDAISRS